MKRILTAIAVIMMAISALAGCGADEAVNNNEPLEEQKENKGIEICFDAYTQNFGKDLESVEEYYKDVGELQVQDGWLGVIWYQLTDDELLGFSPQEEENVFVSAYVPVSKIYPEIFANGTLTKEEFEEYIKTETELVPLFDESEISSPYLIYDYEGLQVYVFCDDEGNVDQNSSCMFFQV